MPDVVYLIAVGMGTSALGVVAGLGGAIILVPILLFSGWTPIEAAPLGLMSVAAGSVAGGAKHLEMRSVNHRIGVTTELAASCGAVSGAHVAARVPDSLLVYVLAVAALVSGVLGFRRNTLRNPPRPEYHETDVGERVGSLSGAYPVDGGVAPYETRRIPLGLAFMALAGLVAGTTGTGGGFIKTPVASEIMHVPTRVAAGTTTFTVGITASAALLVYAAQGRVDVRHSSAVVFGALLGGLCGAVAQSRLRPVDVRRVSSMVLVLIAVMLVAFR